ncbi:zinc-dependent metalloprotease family protein [Arthrobacter sp. zg-Y750]|uniref:zinc-dependent metalloprotease family protein n=1 Tax=Arthrobacter sp. zg-Y750 TaxID=2894189 RepID=UPI001E60BB30|nr:zinc-dependent metalloprotease family protein [Arthrobacter sp. zg-Y750]MCC9177385.1 hypothetical protein [Arthrobacter sp. zg-Y750]
MKSAKLAMLAVLAATLTAGSLPAQAPFEVPQPAPTDVAGSGEAPAVDPVQSPAPGEVTEQMTAPAADPAAPAPVTAPATDPAAPAPATAPAAEPAADGGYDPVVGGGFPVPGPNTPMVTDPDGTVRSAVETDITAVHGQEAGTFSSRSGGAATAGGAAARNGTIQVTLVYATLTDNRNGVDQDAAWHSVLAADTYWRNASNQRLGINIANAYSINSNANSGMDYSVMMDQLKRDIGWRDTAYTALVVYVPAADLRSGGYGGILGGGWTTNNGTGGTVVMPRPSNFSKNVVTHELGHVLGLLHANSLKCDNGRSDIWVANGSWADPQCTSREYGDTSDLMGYAQYSLPMINSYFWDSGAFGRGDEIYNAGTPAQSATYILRPWAGSSANRAVKFRDTSGETYYLELRLPVGNDSSTAVGGNRGVKIVKADLANNWAVNSLVIAPNTRDFAGYTNANSTWQAGQTFVAHTGTTVKINWIDNESASVTVSGGATARALAPIQEMRAAHPELGSATSEVTGGLRNGGAYQNFQNGVILWSDATGARISFGGIRSFYGTTGYQDGFLGYPTSNEYGVAGGAAQDFQGGRIFWSANTGASYVLGAIGSAYINKGGPAGPLGFPVGNEWSLGSRGGVVQAFQKGAIYWTPSTGAHIIGGAVQTYYGTQGYEAGFLGYPTSDEISGGGGVIQTFEGGAIAWSPETGGKHLYKGMAASYMNHGGPGGALGFPIGVEKGLATRAGATQEFQKGAIYWSPRTGGAPVLNGPVRDAYKAKGAEASFLGYPTASTVNIGGGSSQSFEGGRVTMTAASGVRTVYAGMDSGYARLGGPGGSLGYPVGDETAAAKGGVFQAFEKGNLYWSAATGSYAVMKGAPLDAYGKAGAENGLGYPTGNPASVAGGTIQSFERGRMAWSPSSGARLLFGAVDGAFAAANGPAGPYGFPTGEETASIGSGITQNFQYGTMYWSPSTGAQFVGGAVKVTYGQQNSEKGSLGYPTTNERPTAGGVIQDFQGGSILWSPATGAYTAFGAIRAMYLGAGGPSGDLGFPVGGEKTTAPNTASQEFQRGTIHWSATGGSRIAWK